MSVTVIATPGAVDANSFATVSEIDTYYLSRVPATTAAQWQDAADDDKAAAAIMATLWMTNLIKWRNYTTTTTQSLPWPRYNMWRRNGWSQVPQDEVPQEVKNAQAELARLFLISDRTEELQQLVNGVGVLKVGPIQIAFRNPSGRGVSDPPPPIIPDFIIDLLVPEWVEYVTDLPDGMRDLVRA